MDATKLKVWLPFDESTTADKCGNSWTATGSPTISNGALQFSANNQYLSMDGGITLGGKDFTIRGKFNMSSSSGGHCRIFSLYNAASTTTGCINLARSSSNASLYSDCMGSSSSNFGITLNVEHDFEYAYIHADSTVKIFIDGVQQLTFTKAIPETYFPNVFINKSNWSSDGYLIGSIDEFMVFDGVALHTANFTPPTASDYAALALELDSRIDFTADVQRRIGNRFSFTADVQRTIKTKWRYVNLGTTDTLYGEEGFISGFTLENLDESQSKTGTAFYQTAREKCFDIPDTDEVWIKFDVYQDSSDQWRAYNDGSAGICGLFSYDHTTFRLFANGTAATDIANIFKTNQLQTVLLHMISGSSAGIIEAWVDGTKIYTYTGDVNHGEDFADIYLQSDGEGTFFSNVIISNAEIGLNDGYITFSADVQRRISSRFELIADVQRKVNNVISFEFDADVVIRDILPVTFSADVQRRLTTQFEFSADVAIFDTFPFEFDADINRAIKGKVKLFAIDTSEYFSGGGLSSSADLADDDETDSDDTLTPTVIPSQRIPAAPDNTIGLQSIEISLNEQQLTDNVAFVGVVPFDIMFPVQGQYLDYVFDLRVERVQQKGVLYSCECCADIDQLLYTQIAYTIEPNEFWHKVDDEFYQKTKTEKEEWQKIWRAQGVFAHEHARKIAHYFGKTPVIQFDEFPSNIFIEDNGGVTYADLIRDIFGWSSRVPTHLINVFIRNDKIFFVQRGHEAHLLDLSGTKHTIPTVTHELVRMTWGSTPWSKTETRGTKSYRRYDWNGEQINPQFPKSSDEVDNPDNPDNPDAQVGQTETTEGDVHIITKYEYTEGGQISKTETTVYKSGKEQSRTTVTRDYVTLTSGQVFLSKETKIEYEWAEPSGIQLIGGWKEVDRIVTKHTPTMQGQAHVVSADSDGNVIGEDVGQNTGDDRVSPHQAWQWVGKAKLGWNTLNPLLSIARILGTARTNLEESGDEETLATFDNEFPALGEWEDVTLERTLYGLNLYDASFPITDQTPDGLAKLIELTEAIKWLNRRTKETISMTIYEYPHLIDFNDRIIFNGAEYFLVSNIATTNARIFNEQRITFTRWY